MSWIGRLLGTVPRKERHGIRLDTTAPFWEVDAPETFEVLLNALQGWIPENAILYFEGGCPDAEIEHFFATRSVPEGTRVALGTIWPRPKVYHVPATSANLVELASIMQHHAEPELAIHFHVYQDDTILLEWHDAFAQPMLVSGAFPEEKLRRLAERMGTDFRLSDEPP